MSLISLRHFLRWGPASNSQDAAVHKETQSLPASDLQRQQQSGWSLNLNFLCISKYISAHCPGYSIITSLNNDHVLERKKYMFSQGIDPLIAWSEARRNGWSPDWCNLIPPFCSVLRGPDTHGIDPHLHPGTFSHLAQIPFWSAALSLYPHGPGCSIPPKASLFLVVYSHLLQTSFTPAVHTQICVRRREGSTDGGQSR